MVSPRIDTHCVEVIEVIMSEAKKASDYFFPRRVNASNTSSDRY